MSGGFSVSYQHGLVKLVFKMRVVSKEVLYWQRPESQEVREKETILIINTTLSPQDDSAFR